MTGVRRLIPLTFGWEDLPKSVSVHGADPSIRLREPVPGVLCEIDGGWLLLDTGFNDPLIRDPALYRRFHGRNHDIRAELLPGDPSVSSLELAFELVGVDPDDVQLVAVSHLHNDHAGGLRHFAGRVPVHCQRRELDYGLGHHPAPEEHGIFRIDFDDDSIDWRLADGSADIAPGVVAVPTYGHTPGHQSFVVTLADELADGLGVPGFVLAFDAADLQENIDDELAVGGFIDTTPDETIDAIRRLKAIAAEKGFRVVPGHDPHAWPTFTTEPRRTDAVSLVVRGGIVVTPAGERQADVVIVEGRIQAVEPPGSVDSTGNVAVDAGGLIVLPGMVDAHVHFDEPGRTDWEGFDTGSAASAAGGVTTVVDMPIDCDPPTITAAAVTAKVEAARLGCRVDVALWGGLVPASVAHMAAMADAGVAGFKAFACPTGWDDFPASDEATLIAGMALAAARDLPVAVHCELVELGHTIGSEVLAIRWAAGLAAQTGARLHVVHVSSSAGVDEARRWAGVTIETCPHYLTLDACGRPEERCFPPLRDRHERDLLWIRVCRGDVDTVASDHSPCLPSGRATWAGIDGAGMTIPLLLSDGRLTLGEVARLTTEAARLLRLPGKGAIAPGFDGDLALVDPAATWVVDDDSQWSRHRQSPYVGNAITGRVVQTLVRGHTVFSLDDGPCPAGGATFIRPAPAVARPSHS